MLHTIGNLVFSGVNHRKRDSYILYTMLSNDYMMLIFIIVAIVVI
jgi:hypothetical protein